MNKANPSTIVALNEEIESLRQRLSAAQEDANHAWEKACEACTAHAASIKREVVLWVATKKALNGILFHHDPEQVRVGIDAANEALAATADLDGLILCHAKPDSYRYKHHDSFSVGFFWSHRPTHQGSPALESVPLFTAWEPK